MNPLAAPNVDGLYLCALAGGLVEPEVGEKYEDCPRRVAERKLAITADTAVLLKLARFSRSAPRRHNMVDGAALKAEEQRLRAAG